VWISKQKLSEQSCSGKDWYMTWPKGQVPTKTIDDISKIS